MGKKERKKDNDKKTDSKVTKDVGVIQLLNLKPAMEKLIQMDFPVKISLQIFSFIKNVNSELEIIGEQQKRIFEKWVQPNPTPEDPNFAEVPPKDMSEYRAEMEEMYNVEAPFTFLPLKISMFDNKEVSPGTLMSLEPFMK